MLTELFVFFLAIATGYAASGLVASGYQLLTDKPASFQVVPESVPGRLLYVPVLALGGPVILMRNAVRAQFIEGRPRGWLYATIALASGWSFVSGLLVLRAML
ncbi:MAG: hypothetical protein AAF619_03745 [Pseudomonadota bacterium]